MNWRGLFGPSLDRPGVPVRVLGIDLGTTYSTVTRVAWDGDPDTEPDLDVVSILQDDGGGAVPRPLVPSTVAIDAEGRVLVGEGARAFRRKASKMLVAGANFFEATKNDIGTSKVFPHAPPELRSPTHVAASILRFVIDGVAQQFPGERYDKVVVTVPASFQLTQREETLNAVIAAGIDVTGCELLDEPIAALLAWLGARSEYPDAYRQSMVIDFGGGTCDVAMLSYRSDVDGLDVEVIGTSRYCRLGGSDIDRAIAVDVLLPRLAAATGVSVQDWSYPEKNGVLIPALAGAAEELKLKLSRAMYDRVQNGRPFDDLVARGSRDAVAILRGRQLRLPAAQVSLTAEEFRRIIEPTINTERMRPHFGEYFETASVFAATNDLLVRTGREFHETDHLLLAGGSSYLQPVKQALEDHFGVAADYVAPFEGHDQQTEISRGAALQAFAQVVMGRPLAQLVSGEAVELTLTDRVYELVPADVPLPWQEILPDTKILTLSDGRKPLRLEFRRAAVGLSNVEIPVPAGSQAGDPFELRCGLDANGQLHAEIEFKDGTRRPLVLARPGTYIANPGTSRQRILNLEGELTLDSTTPERAWEIRRELAHAYRRIGHKDRALTMAEALVKRASTLRERGQSAHVKGLALAEHGHIDEAVKAYEDAIDDGAAWLRFNLAFMLDSKERYDEALKVIDEYLDDTAEGAAFALKGSILNGLGERQRAQTAFQRARNELGGPRTASPFELSWIRYVARQLDDVVLLEEVRAAEQGAGQSPAAAGALPMVGDA